MQKRRGKEMKGEWMWVGVMVLLSACGVDPAGGGIEGDLDDGSVEEVQAVSEAELDQVESGLPDEARGLSAALSATADLEGNEAPKGGALALPSTAGKGLGCDHYTYGSEKLPSGHKATVRCVGKDGRTNAAMFSQVVFFDKGFSIASWVGRYGKWIWGSTTTQYNGQQKSYVKIHLKTGTGLQFLNAFRRDLSGFRTKGNPASCTASTIGAAGAVIGAGVACAATLGLACAGAAIGAVGAGSGAGACWGSSCSSISEIGGLGLLLPMFLVLLALRRRLRRGSSSELSGAALLGVDR